MPRVTYYGNAEKYFKPKKIEKPKINFYLSIIEPENRKLFLEKNKIGTIYPARITLNLNGPRLTYFNPKNNEHN